LNEKDFMKALKKVNDKVYIENKKKRITLANILYTHSYHSQTRKV